MKKTLFITILTLLISGSLQAKDVQHTLKIDGITCPFCVATSAKALKKIEGVKTVKSNLKAGTLKICADDKTVFTDAELTDLFREKGFTYKGMSKQEKCDSE